MPRQHPHSWDDTPAPLQCLLGAISVHLSTRTHYSRWFDWWFFNHSSASNRSTQPLGSWPHTPEKYSSRRISTGARRARAQNRVLLTHFWITVRDPSGSRRNQVARLRALSGNTHASDWWKRPYSCSYCYKFRNARLQRARPAFGLSGPSRKVVGFLSRSVDDKSAIWRSEWRWWNQFCCC